MNARAVNARRYGNPAAIAGGLWRRVIQSTPNPRRRRNVLSFSPLQRVPTLVPGLLVPILLGYVTLCSAAEVIPPAPARYFNDYANVVSRQTADGLNEKLAEFDKTTSSQVVVAIFPKMQSESSLEDYVHRMFQAWQIGQKSRNNGVLLAVFVQERRLRIEVGYGLEGALPDALAKRIIDDEITPQFKRGDFDAGLTAGVNAILQATRGEYKGRGGSPDKALRSVPLMFAAAVGIFLLLVFLVRVSHRGTVFTRAGRRQYGGFWGWNDWSSGSGWGSSGGGGGWGGSSSGSSFSGGGGSSGGGGASGSW